MIIIKYRGGLGNQMFQYAFHLAMQKHYPETEVVADLSHYEMNCEHNGFELEKVFGIQVKTLPGKELKKYSPYYVPTAIYEKLPAGLRNLIANNLQHKYYRWKCQKGRLNYYKQQYHNTFEPRVFSLDPAKTWYVDGLWQDFRYFKDLEEEIEKQFRFRNEERYAEGDMELIRQIRESESVGIHVRRGDFVNSKFDICNTDYYKKAVEEIRKRANEPLTYFFFTDDSDYVNEYFKDMPDKRIISHGVANSIVDMEFLSLCHNAIISNSTFALWAAWLSRKQLKHVVAPKYSIINKGKNFDLIVPENWTQI